MQCWSVDSENSRRPFVGSVSGFARLKVARESVLPEYAGASEDSAVVSFGDSGRFASGMAARKGEDPLAGLQRSL